MDILLPGIVLSNATMLLVGLVFGHLLSRPRKRTQRPVIEKPQVYHDRQARRLLAQCDNLAL